jgi:hypothetical protein
VAGISGLISGEFTTNRRRRLGRQLFPASFSVEDWFVSKVFSFSFASNRATTSSWASACDGVIPDLSRPIRWNGWDPDLGHRNQRGSSDEIFAGNTNDVRGFAVDD